MPRRWWWVVMIGAALACGVAGVPPSDAATGLLRSVVAYWPLDETSGTRYDRTGRGNNLTDNNTVGYATGKIGNAANFVAANSEYLNQTDNADNSAGDVDFTVLAHVKFASLTDYHFFFAKANGGSAGTYNYNLFRSGSTSALSWSVSTGAADIEVSDFTPSTSTWYWVIGWHDPVQNVVGIQVDARTPVTAAWSSGIANGTYDLRLGKRGDGYYHNGDLDQAVIIKRVLTAHERAAMYNAGAGRSYESLMRGYRRRSF